MKIFALIALVLLVGCATSDPSIYEPPATKPIYN